MDGLDCCEEHQVSVDNGEPWALIFLESERMKIQNQIKRDASFKAISVSDDILDNVPVGDNLRYKTPRRTAAQREQQALSLKQPDAPAPPKVQTDQERPTEKLEPGTLESFHEKIDSLYEIWEIFDKAGVKGFSWRNPTDAYEVMALMTVLIKDTKIAYGQIEKNGTSSAACKIYNDFREVGGLKPIEPRRFRELCKQASQKIKNYHRTGVIPSAGKN
ncbi:MAG: hypothetical protein H0X30_22710 [Anaerolineae bacterium]|nr:hypothetical protein [Anaerolineae bacterium]